MPVDPTGRYKGNRYDPNYAAKKKAGVIGGGYNKYKDHSDHPEHHQHHQHGEHGHQYHGSHERHERHERDNGWGNRNSDRGSSMGPSASSYSHPPRSSHFDHHSHNHNHHPHSPSLSSSREHYNNHSGNHWNRSPSDPYTSSRDFSHPSPHQRSDRINPDRAAMMGNQHGFEQGYNRNPQGNGYGARAYGDFAEIPRQQNQPNYNKRTNDWSDAPNGRQDWDSLPYGSRSSPSASERPVNSAAERKNVVEKPVEQQPPQAERQTYATVTAAPLSADQTVNQPSTNSGQGVTTTATEPELDSLEKLKLFKAQVEATRARNTGQAADTVTRVAESFLLSQAQQRESNPSAVDTPTGAPSTMMPPPLPQQSLPAPQAPPQADSAAAEADVAADGNVPREQLLKAKLRQKLAKGKGGNTTPVDSPVQQATLSAPTETFSAPTPQVKVPPKTEKANPQKKNKKEMAKERQQEAAKAKARALEGAEADLGKRVPPPHIDTNVLPPRPQASEKRNGGRSISPDRSQHSPTKRYGSPSLYDRRPSISEQGAGHTPSERYGHGRMEPATPLTAAPSQPPVTPMTPSADWVVRQMELLKAQMNELQKLIPTTAMPSPAAEKPEPWARPEGTPREYAPDYARPMQYETPTRRYPPASVRGSPPRLSPEPHHERGSVHASRQQHVPKHGGKPYDRPEYSHKPYRKKPFDKYDKPYDKPYNKYDRPYDKPYDKPYDGGFKKYHHKHDDHEGGYKGGYNKYRHSSPGEERFEKKPHYKPYNNRYDGDGESSRGGGPSRGRGRGRGGYSNHGERPHREYNPNYKKNYGGYDHPEYFGH